MLKYRNIATNNCVSLDCVPLLNRRAPFSARR